MHTHTHNHKHIQRDRSTAIGNMHKKLATEIWSRGFYRATAMLSAVYAVVVCLSVCLCVCVSVTLRYCIKTAKRRITQITPHDSPVTLVF